MNGELNRHRATGYPRRIVCLTEETTETLYLLGEEARIVGVSGYTVRPREARSKPRVSAFTSARLDRIEQLSPDLVLAFSDLQADIAAELIRRGLTVLAFNQRSVGEILQVIRTLADLVGASEKGRTLVSELASGLEAIEASARRFPRRPRVFFEEWKDPLISGIQWVEELVELAGGQPIFPELRHKRLGRDRIVDPGAVLSRDPEFIIASWCGVKVNKARIRDRAGWSEVAAVRRGQVYEIKSTYILQPGPAALTEGLRQLHLILAHVSGFEVDVQLRPSERVDPDLESPVSPAPATA
jgi:iron complex transport system substrate-binding protein